jgi:hypothetical protein
MDFQNSCVLPFGMTAMVTASDGFFSPCFEQEETATARAMIEQSSSGHMTGPPFWKISSTAGVLLFSLGARRG